MDSFTSKWLFKVAFAVFFMPPSLSCLQLFNLVTWLHWPSTGSSIWLWTFAFLRHHWRSVTQNGWQPKCDNICEQAETKGYYVRSCWPVRHLTFNDLSTKDLPLPRQCRLFRSPAEPWFNHSQHTCTRWLTLCCCPIGLSSSICNDSSLNKQKYYHLAVMMKMTTSALFLR